MKDFRNHAQAIIKSNGGRLTKTKQAVIEILQKSMTPLTPHALAKKINKNGHIDTVTVYRILENFLTLGIIHKTENGFVSCEHHDCGDCNKAAKKSIHCHHHFTCKNCSTVKEIHIDDREFLQALSAKFKDIKISAHNFNFSGFCKNCSKNF